MQYQRGEAVLSGVGGETTEPRLLDEVRRRLRQKHDRLRTERIYVEWIRAFIRFSGRRHPSTLDSPEVEAFLNHLAVARDVAPSTRNHALSARSIRYRELLGTDLPWLEGVVRAKRQCAVPAVPAVDDRHGRMA